MAMPEAPVDENDCPKAWKGEVRAAGKAAVVQAKAKSRGVQALSQHHLRFRIPTPDAAHIVAALLWRVDIHVRRPLRRRRRSV